MAFGDTVEWQLEQTPHVTVAQPILVLNGPVIPHRSFNNNGDGASLTPTRWHLVIASMIDGNTIKKTAEIVGVSPRTIYRLWEENTDFQRLYKEAAGRVVAFAIEQANAAAHAATETLLEICTNPMLSDGARLAAANSILQRVERNRDFTEIVKRLDRIEQMHPAVRPRFAKVSNGE